MSDNPKEIETNSTLSKWTRLLFALSLVLLGVTFTLQGLGIVTFPAKEEKIKPVRAGGIRCDEPIWNFGAIDSVKNPRLTHEFILVNESKETVAIQKVHSTCGCMVADGYDKELEPGKSTKLKVDVQLPPTPGTFHKSLAVQLEGQKPAVLPLEVIGEQIANSSMFSVPARVNFGAIYPGETKERIVQILRYDLSPVLFVEARGNDEHLVCQLEPLGTHVEHKVMLRVCLIADEILPAGQYFDTITIITGNPVVPEYLLTVSAFVEKMEESECLFSMKGKL